MPCCYRTLSEDNISDDHALLYTNEYLKANGTFNWSTLIASFKLPNRS